MMVSESATVSGFILPGNHRSPRYAITYDAVYSSAWRRCICAWSVAEPARWCSDTCRPNASSATGHGAGPNRSGGL